MFITNNPITDGRGDLVSLESNKNIPFDIKRVYYLYNLNDSARGFHAHKNLKQYLFCAHGSCSIKLDYGHYIENVNLSHPNVGIFLDRLIWREMYNFSEDCVLVVLANEHYFEDDYIRDYNEFKKLVFEESLK